ncbi:U3 snoRNP protein [Loxospora ochrophaea]|nr:U3 snoRNP protein [Loxospora ochrophaea]
MASTVLSLHPAELPQPVVQHQPPADLHPSSDQVLLSTLSTSLHTFLQPPPALHTAALVRAKRYLDPLASSASEAQEQRLQATRRKRKRGEGDDVALQDVLRLKQVHLEGFTIGQVWEQARRVLDASRSEVERCLHMILPVAAQELQNPKIKEQKDIKLVRFDEDGFEIGDPDGEDLEEASQSSENREGQEDSDEDSELEAFLAQADAGESHEKLGDGFEDDGQDSDGSGEGQGESMEDDSPDTFVADKNGLNDGFFSIDDFNKQSEFLEAQDARGDFNADAASDEEEIDWDADPITQASTTANQSRNPAPDADLDIPNDSDSDDGPTFGNANHNAPLSPSVLSSDSDLPLEDPLDISNTNSIHYSDFFAPPPRRATKTTRLRALPKTQPPPQNEQDLERTISSVRRDLFEDDLSEPPSDTEPNANPISSSGPLSTHQTRQAGLLREIRILESTAVAKRAWTLSGEARAADRPLNSLLEEDVEFERTGKPVPVITNEVSEDIEDLIKRRILAREFDEVVRRRPEDALQVSAGERKRFELDDSRPEKSLAEVYEAERMGGGEEKLDAKTEQQQEAIAQLWREVSGALDALSSWHYRPRPAEVGIKVVEDVPRVRVEDARPGMAVGGVLGGEERMLAPQEVYRVGEGGRQGEGDVVVVGNGRGGVVSKGEMSREEKVRRRRREKERARKRGGDGGAGGAGSGTGGGTGASKANVKTSSKKREKDEVLSQLQRSGVTVIGRKGELRDVQGRKAAVKGNENAMGGGGFKL